jgi:DNA-binding IclR family transcriptional regulator
MMDGLTHEDEEKDRNFVTALARGLELLRCFRHNEVTLTNSDFSERTGLPKATISRLTHTLCALDYLVADARVGTYRLSSGVLQLGYGVLSSMDIADRAEYEMEALREGPNSYITVALGEQHRLDVIYLMTKRSFEGVSLAIRVGSRLPVFHSAIGRAILVGMRGEDRERVFEMAQAKGQEAEAEGRKNFALAAAEYADKGFCSAYGTWRSDVNGIAVPVRSPGGARVYGLNVGGPSFRVKKRELETVYAEKLIRAAEMLSIGN